MTRYILKRLAFMLVTLIVISATTFWMMHSVPGNPLENKVRKSLPPQVMENFMKKYGLDRSIGEQYLLFIKNAFQGDLGESIIYPGQKVAKTIRKTAPVSGKLGFIAIAIGFTIGVTFGFIAALNRGKWPDYVVIGISILGVTIPSFVMASLLQFSLGNKLRLLPISYKKGHFDSMIMPIIALSFGTIATYARYMRSSVLEVINSDYILTAQAKGVSRMGVLLKHVLKNAMIPAITILGPQIVGVFAGSFIIEKIFNVPGLGMFLVSAISDRDYPMIIATTVLFGFLFVVSQLLVDIVYGILDPRIKVSE
ncbi:MAG: ABC transporter permease [Tissierellia bacterium]|nr:ABC transporter permease [Tissierellia bacterium]